METGWLVVLWASAARGINRFFAGTMLLTLLGLLLSGTIMLQQHTATAEVQERKQQYSQAIRDNYQPIICCFRDESIPVFAHAGKPLPDRSMYRMFHRLQNPRISTTDFDVAILTRTLYLTGHDDLKTEIITGMQDLYDKRALRFWLTEGETHFTYWTENHIILWLSSTWLLRPHLAFRDNDDAIIFLETRLRHFLTTTLEKGPYEFFSTNYYPFTLGALLNLYDFAPESEIRDLASQLLTRLLGEVLLFVNDEGAFYPVAGRNMIHRYVPQPFISMVWFLTGQGPGPTTHDFFGCFMATSSFDLADIITTWNPIVDVQFSIGHSTVKELKATHEQNLPSRSDRVMFQWSASSYAEPEAVSDTAWVIREFALDEHVLLKEIGVIAAVVGFGFDFLWQTIFRILGGQTEGWDIMGANVSIFKHKGVVLSSLKDFNVGNRGTQQWPWMATVGNIPVWTQSGVSGPTFENLSFGKEAVANTHLPQVVQKENVCVIAYKPRPGVYFVQPIFSLVGLGFTTGVGLYFPSNEFDEVRESGRWIMGRKGDNYIGIWRHSTSRTDCSGQDESCLSYYFSDPKLYSRAQSWAAVVGNAQTHGSFDSFYGRVSEGTLTEKKPTILRWLLSLFTKASSYESLLTVDGKTVKASM